VIVSFTLPLFLGSEIVLPFVFKLDTPMLSVLRCLMKDQNMFVPEYSLVSSCIGDIMDSTYFQYYYRYYVSRYSLF